MKIKSSLLITSISTFFSMQAMANDWQTFKFPEKDPIYEYVEKYDIEKKAKLNFSCINTNKDNLIITLPKLKLDYKKGHFEFISYDQEIKKITGTFMKTEDGVISLITQIPNLTVLETIKKSRGISLILKHGDEELEKLNFDLSGSYHTIDKLIKRCKNL